MSALNMRTVSIAELTPDPLNVRRHDDKNLDAIRRSLEAFGQRKPIVVARGNGGELVVIAGNGTLEAARSLGWTELAVAEVPADWDHDKARAYAIADNRTAELADWDDVALASALVDLDAVGWNIRDLGFEPATLGGDGDTEQVEDIIPEPPAEPTARIGDVWNVGPHRIVCGDSSDEWALKQAFGDVTVGCLLTDPPYGINLDTDYTKLPANPGTSQTRYAQVANDDKPFDAGQLYAHFASVREQFWFGANYYRRTIPDPDLAGSWLVWDKRTETNDTGFGSGFELVWSRQRHKQDLLRYLHFGMFSVEPGSRVHPTQKPVALLSEILERWAPTGGVVADPFAGSGATLVAAVKTGRVGRGIELDPRYVDVIVKRLEAETGLVGECVRGDG
jgi:hypothetical protein